MISGDTVLVQVLAQRPLARQSTTATMGPSLRAGRDPLRRTQVSIDGIAHVDTLHGMKTKVAKWGNSLALRIPRAMAATHDLREGTDVELIEGEQEIRLRPFRPHEKFDLDAMLAGVNEENLHREETSGEPRGREIW